jgi:hypothetical protein
MYSAVLLVASLIAQTEIQSQTAPLSAAPSTLQRLEATNSRLIATIEKLEARLAELEKRLAESPATNLPHGSQLDPDAVPYAGGRWVEHPQTKQLVFAENEFQRRSGGGGSLIIELIRHKGKPVALPSVTWGETQTPRESLPPRPAPTATLTLPMASP